MSSHSKHDSKLTTEYDEKLESASESGSQPTDLDRIREEKRLVRKLDNRILPIACFLYLFACKHTIPLRYFRITDFKIVQDLDRSNLGNARLQGLPEDILGGDKTGVLFDWINSAFFFSYVSLNQNLNSIVFTVELD